MAPRASSSAARRRRAPVATALCIGAAAVGAAVAVAPQAFTVPSVTIQSKGRKAVTAMHAEGEAFDPFGWKGKFKEGLAGIMGEMVPDVPPTKLEEAMITEIFEKFDVDGDKVLNIDEFNTLQRATEGEDAVYNSDQLKDLLLAVNPEMKNPEAGMPFADYRRLYVEGRLKRAYSTDVSRDHVKIFGPNGGVCADPSKYAEDEVIDMGNGMTVGTAVTIEGLSGAVELNGQSAKVVAPVDSEKAMVAEGRVIVQLSDGERIALKTANVKVAA